MANLNLNFDVLTKLSEWWGIVKSNFTSINDQVESHITGMTGKHNAQNINYSGNIINSSNIKEGLDNLHDRVEAIITTPVEGVSVQEIIDARKGKITLRAKIDDIDSYLSDLAQVSIREFGASLANTDNHDNIIAALDYLKAQGGGTLLIPLDGYGTAPLILNGYYNITIKGVAPSLPWAGTSCLKIISPGLVGLQLSEVSGLGYTNEVPTWNSISIRVENLHIDGNHKVDHCINGNHDVIITGCNCEHALKEGIVLEPMSYPITVEYTTSRYNGKHGLYVKAPYTTVYNVHDCEFTTNDGYGIVIEDGNTSGFRNCNVQANKQGGVKLVKKDPTLYTHDVFLAKLLFENLYTEANGTLLETDPNFEGNCAFKTVSYNTTKGMNAGKISGLTFINCTINPSIVEGTTSKGFELNGLMDITTINTTIPDGAINYETCGTMEQIPYLIGDDSEIPVSSPLVINFPLHDTAKNIRAMVGDGYIGKRGRMRELEFTLPYSSIVLGSPVIMNTPNGFKFYPTLQKGSIYGINIMQKIKPSSGTLTFKVKYGYTLYASLESYINLPTLQLNNTTNYVSLNFPLLKYDISDGLILGIEVTASSDYVAGNVNSADILCGLFIES